MSFIHLQYSIFIFIYQLFTHRLSHPTIHFTYVIVFIVIFQAEISATITELALDAASTVLEGKMRYNGKTTHFNSYNYKVVLFYSYNESVSIHISSPFLLI